MKEMEKLKLLRAIVILIISVAMLLASIYAVYFAVNL
jgi:hypothetical protein